MGAVAIKKSSREKTAGLQEMGTLRCDGCGEEFILGHNPTLFTTPQLAQYFLAGIQFILGDLEADTTPSAKLTARKQK